MSKTARDSYLATALVCGEAVRSAILATAWLLVSVFFSEMTNLHRHRLRPLLYIVETQTCTEPGNGGTGEK